MLDKLRRFLGDSKNQKKYAKWLLEYSRQHIWALSGLTLLNITLSLLGIASSVATKYVIDLATAAQGLTMGIALMVVLSGLNIALGIVSSVSGTVINEKYSFSIRIKIYDGILRTKWPELTRYKSGDLITRMTSDVGSVTSGITSVVPSVLTLFIQLVTAFFVLFYYDRGLALFALIIAPVATGASLFLGTKLKKLQVKVQESESAYNAFLHESLDNIIAIKSFCSEEESVKKLSELRRDRFYWVFKRTRFSVLTSSVVSVAYTVAYLVAFGLGAMKIQSGLITFGTMALFLSMVSQIQSPLIGLGRMIPSLVSVLASAGRLVELSELRAEMRREGIFKPGKVNVRLENVSFTYGGDYVLRNVDVDILAGESVAVTGKTGAGKTTLIKLLMSFVDPTEGAVVYSDGDGNTEPANADSRDYIAYIPQGNFLFTGSIAENLRLGKPDASEEEIREALISAAAEDFVDAMSMGADTVIGERGEGLSEGQGQRIAIARAFIKKSPFMILDEATSALDEKTEQKILEAISKMPHNPTCLIITHRKAAAAICQRHLHVEGDKVFEI